LPYHEINELPKSVRNSLLNMHRKYLRKHSIMLGMSTKILRNEKIMLHRKKLPLKLHGLL
jgi:hypothetical protein